MNQHKELSNKIKFAPIVAGIGKMDYATFLKFNLIGGVIWASILSLLGYGLGNVIPDVDKYLLPIAIAIVVISVVPSLLHLLPERDK